MDFSKSQIEFAAEQIGRIDSGEKSIFLENINTQNCIEAKILGNGYMSGVFFSCMFYGNLRVHIAFSNDTDEFNKELAELIRLSLKKANKDSAMIWLRNENIKIFEHIKNEFNIPPEGKYYYASAEYIMRRDNFIKPAENNILEIKPYNAEHIDEYLLLLDEAMSFSSSPPCFYENKEYHLNKFAEYNEKNSFEAFWVNGSLIGLYWRNDAEIDIMAVAAGKRRMGYGSAILTRAIEMVFKNTDKDFAYLYAVDWNVNAQRFYEKYGMELSGHSRLLRMK